MNDYGVKILKLLVYQNNQFTEQTGALTALPADGYIWIDAKPAELQDAVKIIQQLTSVTIQEYHLKDLTNRNHPNFFDSMKDYDLLIFRSLTRPQEVGRLKTQPISFMLFEKILFTTHESDPTINKILTRINEVDRKQPTQPELLLHLILNAIVDNFLALRVPLSEKVTYWQNNLLSRKDKVIDWKALLRFKYDLHNLSVLCEEQEDVLDEWRQKMEEGLTQSMAVKLHDLSNHVGRVQRHTQGLEDKLETLMQLHYALINQRTNEIIRVLTVISAIFLPLTLISNTFGMNFDTALGRDNPLVFYSIVAIMIILAVVLLLIFRRKHWI